MIDLARIPRLAPRARLHWDRHGSAWLLLYPERGQILNDTAHAILVRCDGTRSVQTICDELSQKYRAPRASIERDVVALLSTLEAKGLLA